MWGWLLGLVFVAALPPVVMAELDAVAGLPGALGFTGRSTWSAGVRPSPGRGQ